jgi:hypothetical protein
MNGAKQTGGLRNLPEEALNNALHPTLFLNLYNIVTVVVVVVVAVAVAVAQRSGKPNVMSATRITLHTFVHLQGL